MKRERNLLFCLTIFVMVSSCALKGDLDAGSFTWADGSKGTYSRNAVTVDSVGRLTGVNWPGFESQNMIVKGLWARDYKSMLQQMKDLGFNSLRLPFCSENLADNAYPASTDIVTGLTDPYTKKPGMNQDLQGLNCLGVMEKIVSAAGDLGIKVILDNHSHYRENYRKETLWYYGSYTESIWISNWIKVVKRFTKYPNFIGVDLKNEPHGDSGNPEFNNVPWATWGGNAATDWHGAVSRCVKAIYDEDPDLLFFIQGVTENFSKFYWWGGNHIGTRDLPVTTVPNNQIYYSVHEYGPEVAAQDWFNDPQFPDNMPAVWNNMFYYLEKEGLAKVYIGEFGIKESSASNPSSIPYKWITKFLTTMGGKVSWTFWCWTAYSTDTGGLLKEDNLTVEQNKYNLIKGYLAPFNGGTSSSATTSSSVSSSSSSFNNGFNLPGRLEAENYNSMSGIMTESCSEGTLNVGWVDSGDWIDYNITATQAGNYDFEFRLASINTTGRFDIQLDGQTVFGITAPNTSGWQNWTTVKATSYVNAGSHRMRIAVNTGGFNLNWINFVQIGTSSSSSVISSSKSSSSSSSVSTVSSRSSVTSSVISSSRSSSTSTGVSSIKLFSCNTMRDANCNTIGLKFKLSNTGSTAVALNSITYRYYYTLEGSSNQSFWGDYAGGYVNGSYVSLTSSMIGTFKKVNPAKTGASDYLEISFNNTAGMIGPGGVLEMNMRITKLDWSNYNQANDYSFSAVNTDFTENPKVNLWIQNTLGYGVEP